jgi:excisionase family DNA binding protein
MFLSDNHNMNFLSVKEVATLLHLHEMTVYRWIKEKRLTAYKVGGIWRLKSSEVHEWIDSVANKICKQNNLTE